MDLARGTAGNHTALRTEDRHRVVAPGMFVPAGHRTGGLRTSRDFEPRQEADVRANGQSAARWSPREAAGRPP